MELQGAKNCFTFLRNAGVAIAVFISDRHRGIAKWIRESQTNTTHLFDIWHVARSIVKKLLKASKEKGYELIKEWIKGVRNHLYWHTTYPGIPGNDHSQVAVFYETCVQQT